ncbi:MAG: hypothetical protein J6T47_01240 [Lachnospiraceae bacterium]|nr:hypothetical protein [Lachnospiraceae bacterium]
MVVRKKKKMTPFHIAVLLGVLVLYVGAFLYVIKMLHPSDEMKKNDEQLGFCKEMMTEIKNAHKELGPFSDWELNEAEKRIHVTLNYMSMYVNKNTNWLDLNRRMVGTFTEYLNAHPDHRLMTENWLIELDCPSAVYRNLEDGKPCGADFYDVTYSDDTFYTIPEFLEIAYLLGPVRAIHIESAQTGLLANPEKTLSDLKQLKTLKTLELKLPDVPASFVDDAKEAGIEVLIK